jgi:hypothetical protein
LGLDFRSASEPSSRETHGAAVRKCRRAAEGDTAKSVHPIFRYRSEQNHRFARIIDTNKQIFGRASTPSYFRDGKPLRALDATPQNHRVANQIKSYYETILTAVIRLEGR